MHSLFLPYFPYRPRFWATDVWICYGTCSQVPDPKRQGSCYQRGPSKSICRLVKTCGRFFFVGRLHDLALQPGVEMTWLGPGPGPGGWERRSLITQHCSSKTYQVVAEIWPDNSSSIDQNACFVKAELFRNLRWCIQVFTVIFMRNRVGLFPKNWFAFVSEKDCTHFGKHGRRVDRKFSRTKLTFWTPISFC